MMDEGEQALRLCYAKGKIAKEQYLYLEMKKTVREEELQ